MFNSRLSNEDIDGEQTCDREVKFDLADIASEENFSLIDTGQSRRTFGENSNGINADIALTKNSTTNAFNFKNDHDNEQIKPILSHTVSSVSNVSTPESNCSNNPGKRRQKFHSSGSQKSLGSSTEVRRYYERQHQLLEDYENDAKTVQTFLQTVNSDNPNSVIDKLASAERRQQKIDKYLSALTFACNLVLLIIKLAAAALSGSLSVISSVIDSAVDLTSGAVIFDDPSHS